MKPTSQKLKYSEFFNLSLLLSAVVTFSWSFDNFLKLQLTECLIEKCYTVGVVSVYGITDNVISTRLIIQNLSQLTCPKLLFHTLSALKLTCLSFSVGYCNHLLSVPK